MARLSRAKKAPSSSPNKDKVEVNPVLAEWREFYSAEAARLRQEFPNMKGATVKKKVSSAWKTEQTLIAEIAEDT
ncbi:hypothetical protein JCM6882_004459 [Rhodosporidiobolus microsporus]